MAKRAIEANTNELEIFYGDGVCWKNMFYLFNNISKNNLTELSMMVAWML